MEKICEQIYASRNDACAHSELNTYMSIRIQNITFNHYKALENFSVAIEHINILTGLNNSGKSTVLGSLRVLAVALRTARKKKPERIALTDSHCFGYRIKESQVPISLENVATNYVDGTSKISFELTNGNFLHLIFDEEAGCVLIPESKNGGISTAGDFKSQFPIGLTVIPVLGPVEHRETLREVETVTSSLATHRASRHFRNYWYHFPDGFDGFVQLIESTWPGMRIQRPEINGGNDLSMFVSEDRIDRELYWVGFGFQIWCQLLTHLHRADPSTMIVIDEPEVYLHPEIQRRLLQVLKSTGADILVATHSIEIIGEAEPHEVLIIDKRKTRALRKRAPVGDNLRSGKDLASVSPGTSPRVLPATSRVSVDQRAKSGLGQGTKPGDINSQSLASGMTAYLERMDEPTREVLSPLRKGTGDTFSASPPESVKPRDEKQRESDLGITQAKVDSPIVHLDLEDGNNVQSRKPTKEAILPLPSPSLVTALVIVEEKNRTSCNDLQSDLPTMTSDSDRSSTAVDDEIGLSLERRTARLLETCHPTLSLHPPAVKTEYPASTNFAAPGDAGEDAKSVDALSSKVLFGTRSLETCLLLPDLLERAIKAKLSLLSGKDGKLKTAAFPVAGMLMQISHPMKESCKEQFSERVERHFRMNGRKKRSERHQIDQIFDNLWKVPAERMKLVDGKTVLQVFCEQIHFHLKVKISHDNIIDVMESQEISAEIRIFVLERKFNQTKRLKSNPRTDDVRNGVIDKEAISNSATKRSLD